MTALTMNVYGKNRGDVPRVLSGGKSSHYKGNRQPTRPAETHSNVEVTLAEQIDTIVEEGRQADLAQFFSAWQQVPKRAGDWNLLVNERKLDNVVVSRTVVAIPLTVRSRKLFEKGCLIRLKQAGYSDDEARRYYKYAWKKKYVWIDSVIAAVKEMIDAFHNTAVLESFQTAGDPRRLAQTIGVPKNPYLTAHAHFLSAVELAIAIINSRQAAEVPKAEAQQDKPQAATTKTMVMA